MGLKSDKNGVKAQLKARYPQAFREFADLLDARNASMATREQSFSCIDGNVLMHAVPQMARTLDEYVAIITSSLKKAIATSFVTVVVFDNPACLTEAKIQEQRKRDAARQSTAVACSSDMLGDTPVDDNYQKEQIASAHNVHSLVQNRTTRLRFFDEVAMRVLCNLKSLIERWNNSGHKGGHVIFDGIDPRGGDRPVGSPREPQMVGSSDEIAQIFARTIEIGEGDLKLADLGRRVRQPSAESHEAFQQIKLSLCTTIDTDSFAIELIEEAKRCKETVEAKKPFNVLLCMRERAMKRGRDDDREAYYLCCDVSLLQTLLQQSMWGISRSPSPCDRHAAITLLCAGWALCGCDFVEFKGMRSDVVFESIPTVIKTIPSAVESTKNAWSGQRSNVHHLYEPIRALAFQCASKLMDIPKIKKDHLTALRNLDDIIVKRTAWLICYWNSHEFKGSMEEFGFFKPCSDDTVLIH